MNITERLEATCAPADLFAWVEDLSRYPEWLEIVRRAVAEDRHGPRHGVGEAWTVDLRGRIGPLARSKRLRMVCTHHEPPRSVRFERDEQDGREHSPWVLEAEVREVGGGCELRVDLHYGGGFAGRLLERMLREEIERARPRLRALVEG